MVHLIKVIIVLVAFYLNCTWTLTIRKCCDYKEYIDSIEEKCVPIKSKMEYSKQFFDIMDCEAAKTIIKNNDFVKVKLTNNGYLELQFGDSEVKQFLEEFCVDYDSESGAEIAVICDKVVFVKICCLEDHNFAVESSVPNNFSEKIQKLRDDIRIHYVHQKNFKIETKFKFSVEDIVGIWKNGSLSIRNRTEILEDYCIIDSGTTVMNLKEFPTTESKKLKQTSTFTWIKISLGVILIVFVSTYCITYYFPKLLLQHQEG